jgi:CRISPR-associated endonuclease/helicase Cas3
MIVNHSDKIDFGLEKDSLFDTFDSLAKFHDFGKFTTYFQNYLLKKQLVDPILKQHARIGGIVAYNALKNSNEKLALACLYIIFRHHAQLNDITDFTEVFDENLQKIFHLQKKDIENRLIILKLY